MILTCSYHYDAPEGVERKVAVQGVEINGEALRRNGVQFSEPCAEVLLSFGIAVVLTSAATAALAGISIRVIRVH